MCTLPLKTLGMLAELQSLGHKLTVLVTQHITYFFSQKKYLITFH